MEETIQEKSALRPDELHGIRNLAILVHHLLQNTAKECASCSSGAAWLQSYFIIEDGQETNSNLPTVSNDSEVEQLND